ncbi:TetR/AcrR family transcriptional regulator [soil metagenome]
MTTSDDSPPSRGGRPRRAAVDAAVLGAATRLIAERGYSGTTLDQIAAEADVAKSTVYRRWPGKAVLAVDALASALGDLPLPAAGTGGSPRAAVHASAQWLAGRVGDHDVHRLLAGVLAEAGQDPSLRELLRSRIRAPFCSGLARRWEVDEAAVDLAFDVVVGTLLHRWATTGEVDPATTAAVSELATTMLFDDRRV